MNFRVLLVATAAAQIGLLGACHKTGSNAGKDLSNPGQSAPVNTAQDVAAGPVGLVSAATAGGNTTPGYVTGAVTGDQYEILAAKIAFGRTKSPEVRALAQMMLDDHTAMAAKMKSALQQANAGVAPPADLDDRRKGMLDNLRAAGDADFDLAYLHQQLAGHLESLTLQKLYADHGDNPLLKALAKGTVPKIEKHIEMIRKVGGDKLSGAT